MNLTLKLSVYKLCTKCIEGNYYRYAHGMCYKQRSDAMASPTLREFIDLGDVLLIYEISSLSKTWPESFIKLQSTMSTIEPVQFVIFNVYTTKTINKQRYSSQSSSEI